MKRRDFITSLAAAAALGSFPRSVLADAAPNAAAQGVSSWASLFAQALEQKPWLAGYKSVSSDRFQAEATVSGRWPAALTGTLFRNGPAVHEIGGFRYRHWFDGDGMLQAFRIGDGRVEHQARIIQTRKYQAEQAAGRALYPGFASVPPDPAPVTSADLVNVGNISVLPHHGKLLALWEAGSPWEMDPVTLDTRGLYEFSRETRSVPFSAHPRVEPNGTLWNFGYVSSANLLVFWHIDAKGRVVKVDTVKTDPISMPHDFIVTSRHLVLMMPPLNYKTRESGAFLDAHQWHPEQATRLLIVDKNDFGNHRWVELPPQWVFHFGNGWEDEAGVIRFDGARAPDPVAMTRSFREVMRGVEVPDSGSFHYQYRIDTRTGIATEEALLPANVQTEFPAIDPRVSCRRHRRLVVLARDDNHPAVHSNHNQVATLDLESGHFSSFQYPDHQIPEEHLFVAKPGSAPETDGWIIGPSFDWKTQVTTLNLFDVNAVDAGPIASASLPYALPLGLHGKFVDS